MADAKFYKFMGAGPSSLYTAVDSESLQVENGGEYEAIMGQNFAPNFFGLIQRSPSCVFTRTFAGVFAPADVTSFGLYWQALSDAGGLGTAAESLVANAILVPLSVRASKGQVAKTSQRLIWKASPTEGTTTVTPVDATAIYRIGATTFNNTALDGIEEQGIEFGYGLQTNAGQSGLVYPTAWWYDRHMPVAEIRTTDLGVVLPYLNTRTQLATNALVMKFQDQTGAAGYAFTIPQASVVGSIRNNIGTLSITATHGTVILSGATY